MLWCTLTIPVTWETEAGELQVCGARGPHSKDVSQKKKWLGWDGRSVVEYKMGRVEPWIQLLDRRDTFHKRHVQKY